MQRTAQGSPGSPTAQSGPTLTVRATPTPPIRRGSVICASTTRGLSTTPERGKSIDERFAAQPQDRMARYQHIEVHRVEAVRGSVGEPADVPRRDCLAHPLDEPAAILGRANVAQPAQARPRQPTKPWIAHAEESGPRDALGIVPRDALPHFGERHRLEINHRG